MQNAAAIVQSYPYAPDATAALNVMAETEGAPTAEAIMARYTVVLHAAAVWQPGCMVCYVLTRATLACTSHASPLETCAHSAACCRMHSVPGATASMPNIELRTALSTTPSVNIAQNVYHALS